MSEPGKTLHHDGRQAPDLLQGTITAIFETHTRGLYVFMIDEQYAVRVRRRFNQTYKVGDHVTIEARYIHKGKRYHVWNEITMALTASGTFKPVYRDPMDINYVKTNQ